QPLVTSIPSCCGRGPECQDHEYKYKPFKRMLLIAFGCGLGIAGIYIAGFISPCNFTAGLLGIALTIAGWPIVVFHDDLLSIAENAADSIGASGVSAATYGCAEDVRIVPVVVPELELGNIQPQIFTADLVEAAQ